MSEKRENKYALAIVMPVYNEAECISEVITAWHEELSRLAIDFKMIILNDGSRDKTKEALSAFASNDRISLIEKENSGHGPTILRGYHEAVNLADWIFQVDSDNEIKPDYFADLWRKRDSYDALFGIRANRRQNAARKFISIVSRMTVKILFRSDVADVNVPYRLIRAPLLGQIIPQIPGDTFAPNVLISGALGALHARVFNLPVLTEDRKTGTVSIVKWKLWQAAFKSFSQTLTIARKFKP